MIDMTAEEWLAAYDAGKVVPTISMRCDPGSEKSFQLGVIKMVRWLIDINQPKEPKGLLENCIFEEVNSFAVRSLATSIYLYGTSDFSDVMDDVIYFQNGEVVYP